MSALQSGPNGSDSLQQPMYDLKVERVRGIYACILFVARRKQSIALMLHGKKTEAVHFSLHLVSVSLDLFVIHNAEVDEG